MVLCIVNKKSALCVVSCLFIYDNVTIITNYYKLLIS